MNCSICQQPIRQRYHRQPSTNLNVCTQCWPTLPLCQRCKKIEKNLTEVTEGVRWCRDCLAQYKKVVPHCSICRQPIDKRYIKPPGTRLKVCRKCWLRVPHCRRCKKIDKNLLEVEGLKLCQTCLGTINRCTACQAFLVKTYHSRPGSSDKFCARCVHTGLSCAACHNPLGTDFRQLSDDRRICPTCQATAVTDPGQAEALFEQVKSSCQEALNLVVDPPVPLRLVDALTLGQISSRQYRPEDRYFQRPLGLYHRDGDDIAIYLESDLPHDLFLRALAHEYGHAWAGQFDTASRHEVIKEGFAEWVAYSFLCHLGMDSLTARMAQREDYYGVGLKWMLNLERSKGREAIFELLEVENPVEKSQ